MKRELLACGLTVDGQLGMRPNNDYGTVKLPEHIIGGPNDPNGSSVVSVACGEKHTLLLANDGKVWSVGGNDHGQLGRGSSVAPQGSFTIYPVNLTGTKIIQITCGRAHSFAVAEDGRLFGWGSNEHGQLAQANHIKNHNTPKRIHQISEVVQVACGPEHCICLCESGRVFVWGQKWDGANIHEPHEVVELHGIPIVRIEAGGMHCMALSASGRVFAWGQNEYGQLGNNDTRPSTTPVRVEAVDNMKVVDIAAGYSHSVLLTKDGRVFAFGSDQFGQLGLGRKLDRRSTPQVVQELMGSHTSRIACGRCHTMAVIAGKLYSFGLNTSGQLGNGLERNQISPRLADENLDHVAGIFAGWDQTFLIRQGGVFDVNSAPSAPIKYPKFLTGAKIHDLVAKHEKLDLMEMLESVFSSLSCINGSFLFNDDRRFMTNCSGIDLDSVMDSFNLLSSSSDRQLFAELIMNSAEMSIFCEDYPPNKYFSIECVRAFLILPWLDAFVVNVTAETVQGLHLPFAKLLGQLKLEKNGYWKTLEKWWAGLATRHFKRLVSAMMAAARVAVREKWSPYQILPVMSVLDHLSQMNKIYNAIPIDSFYLHELNYTVDLLNDYATWRTDPNKRSWCWSNHPYLLNGIAKVDILRVEASLTQHAVVNRNTINFLGVRIHTQLPYFGIEVRREFILDDTLNQLISTPQIDLMKPLKVKFHGEEGEDAGGIKKEFFMILFQKMLSEEYGMFEEDSESHLKWFQGLPLDDPQADTCFELTGKLCAMAIYNDVLVNLPFPLALYKLLLGQKPVLEDLTELYPTTGKGLDALLNYEDNDFEEIFGLTFTVDYKFMDRTVTEELKPHGAQTSVTKENKHEYVKLFVQHKLEIGMKGRIAKEMELFRRGFEMLISGETMQLFQPRELQEMVIGNENYDWTEFKKVVKYKSEYHTNHPTILTFWEAFFRLTLDERKKFMQFLMGSPRLPVKGISALDISIQPCADHLLPAAHTCANLLDLPKIVDPDEMLRRLRISIQHVEGFTLV